MSWVGIDSVLRWFRGDPSTASGDKKQKQKRTLIVLFILRKLLGF